MIVKKYLSGWQIRLNKKGKYYLYRKGYKMIKCDSLKDARFMHYCKTH